MYSSTGTLNHSTGWWIEHGLCRGVDPALFFPEFGDTGDEAKAVCAECPVKIECLQHAIATGEEHGVWGGTSERQRRRLRKLRRQVEVDLRAAPLVREIDLRSTSTGMVER